MVKCEVSMDGSVGYTFDEPNVTINIDKVTNNDTCASGSIMIKLFNVKYGYDGSYSQTRLIAEFTLSALDYGYCCQKIKRTV
jgi:hypothetical protein